MKYLHFIFLILFSCKSDTQQIEEPNKLIGETANIANTENGDTKRKIEELKKKERKYGGEVKRVVEYWCDELLPNENPWRIDKESCEVYILEEYSRDETQIKRLMWSLFEDSNEPLEIKTVRLNDAGLIIEEKLERKDGSTGKYKPKTRVINSYNSAGFNIEEIVYLYGEFDFREERIYDDYNCLIKELNYDKENKLRYYSVREYDDLNREVLFKSYNGQNQLNYTTRYEYKDDNANWSSKYVDENGEIEKEVRKDKEAIEHHSNGNIKNKHYKDNDEDVYQEFDRFGRIVKLERFYKEKWLNTFTWKYREDGAVLEESESTSNKPGLAYYKGTTFYRVDFNGNWVEKYSIDSEGNITERQVREIEYY